MLNSSPSKNQNKLPGYPPKAKPNNSAALVNDTGIVKKPSKANTSAPISGGSSSGGDT